MIESNVRQKKEGNRSGNMKAVHFFFEAESFYEVT